MQVKKILVGSFGTNCYLVHDDDHIGVLIDPGFDADTIIRECEGMDIRYILLTHTHFDHFSALDGVRERFPAPLAVYEAASPGLTDRSINVSASFMAGGMEASPANILLKDGETVKAGAIELKVLYTPGHTAGDCCYVGDGFLFTGDVLFRDDVGRTDLPGGDYQTLLRSLKRIAGLPGDYTVCPGHGDVSTLEYERCNNPYIREALQ